ncbi:MAG: tRNA 2-thiouridine(34) synthase MnmA [Anaerohalosphaeraceae bacterium]|nr:tRNA 2-thiouridine(34) synthase MnmA [Anaerohalosphaeraceae bacterium]
MSSNGKKVFIALSGGVDSAVASVVLAEAGYECSAVHMVTSPQGWVHCRDAEKIAADLGIPIHVLELENDFKDVLDYFCNEYKNARTPNPCVYCNRNIKFGKILKFALDSGADYLATGHYIRIVQEANGPAIYAATNTAKDQSYILSMVARSALKHILFPLGEFDKSQARAIAKKLGLHIDNKPDSQEICFIPNDDYAAELERLCPEIIRDGQIKTDDGQILGSHKGIYKYTIGQRRGLKIAMGIPYYVTKLDSESNTVILGAREKLLSKELIASEANWLIDEPKEPFAAKIKIRYNHHGSSGTIYPMGRDVRVIFDEPMSAVTPGQTAVFYIETSAGSRLVGGAWIDETSC